MKNTMPNFNLLLNEIKQAILEKGSFRKIKSRPGRYYSHGVEPEYFDLIDRKAELVIWREFKSDVEKIIGNNLNDNSRYTTFGWGFRIDYDEGWFFFNLSLLLNYYAFWEIEKGTKEPNFMVPLFKEQVDLICPIIPHHYMDYERLPVGISKYQYPDLRIEGGVGGREATTFDILFNNTLIMPEQYRD